MCSRPITDEVPVVDAAGQCALCDEVFPFINVVSCRRLKSAGEVPICLTCHQRFHPACMVAQSVLCTSHYECRVCGNPEAAVVCALCSLADSKDEILEGVLMCKSCSDSIHGAAKGHHSDHFYPVASSSVVTVKGPIQWHNVVDIRCEISSSQGQPCGLPVQQQPSASHQCHNADALNQQRDNNPKRAVSGLRPHSVMSEQANQPGPGQRRGRSASFERVSRIV